MTALRWLLVIPAAIAAWYATFIIGAFAYSLIEARLCPAADLISGVCFNRSVVVLLDVTMHVFVAASAIAVVLAATSAAPIQKKEVAWVAFTVGGAIAWYFGSHTRHYSLFVAALVGGLGSLLFFHLRVRSAAPLEPK